MTRDHFEREHHYVNFISAAIEASKAHEAFENLKDAYDKGFVSEESVRAAEDKYIAAKAEEDRLYWLSMGDPPPDPNARWQPSRRNAASAV